MEEILKIQQQIKEIIQRTTDNAILLNIEVWKPIDGYDNYEVSTFGRVKSNKYKTPRILKPRDNGNGYGHVNLCKHGKNKNYSVHRLVANAFLPKQNDQTYVDHIDNNRLNNNVNNLRYVTKQENNQNKSISKNNSSGSPGVSFDNKSNKWASYITINYKKKGLGFFLNKEDAIEARQKASKKYFGEFQNKCEQ